MGEPHIPLDPLARRFDRLAAERGRLRAERHMLITTTRQLNVALHKTMAEMEQLQQRTRRVLARAAFLTRRT